MNSGEESAVDALGLKCPLPVLLARRALAAASPGALITVYADDPLARIDLPAFCNSEGHALLSVDTGANGQIFRIRKA